MSVYNNGNGYSGPLGSGPRPALVRFDAIGEAFNLVKQQAGVWVLATLIYFLIYGALTIPITVALGSMTSGGSFSTDIGSVTIKITTRFFCSVIGYGISAFFVTGFYRMALKQIRGDTISVADLFAGSDAIGPMWLTTALYGFGISAGIILVLLPGIFLTVVWAFAQPLVADQGMAPIDALQTSFNTLKGQFGAMFALTFVAGLIGIAGFLLCGVGLLVTYPIIIVTVAVVYNDFFGGDTAYVQPTIEMPLPPSNPSL